MAGSDRRFPASEFRDAIRFVAQMAKPTDEDDSDDLDRGVYFHWELKRTFNQGADAAGMPLDWSSDADDIGHQEPVSVPVIRESSARALSARDTTVGKLDSDLAVLTLLDEDFVEILNKGGQRLPDYVMIDGDRYNIDKEVPADGIFDVTMHTLVCVAQDES